MFASPSSSRSGSPERRSRSPRKHSDLASVSSDGSRSSAKWQELTQSPLARKLHIHPNKNSSHPIPIPFQLMLPPKLASSPQSSPEMSEASDTSSVSASSSRGRLVYNGSGYERVEEDIDESDPFTLPPSRTRKALSVVHDQLSIIEEASHSEHSSRQSSIKSKDYHKREVGEINMPSMINEEDELVPDFNKSLPPLPPCEESPKHKSLTAEKNPTFLTKYAQQQRDKRGKGGVEAKLGNKHSAVTTPTKLLSASPKKMSAGSPTPIRSGIKVMPSSAQPPQHPKFKVLARTGSNTSRSTVSTPSVAPAHFNIQWVPPPPITAAGGPQSRATRMTSGASEASSSSASSWDSLQQSIDLSLSGRRRTPSAGSSEEWVTDNDATTVDDVTATSPLRFGDRRYGSNQLLQMAPQAFVHTGGQSPDTSRGNITNASPETSKYFEDSVIGAYMVDTSINTTVRRNSAPAETDTSMSSGSDNDGAGKRFSFPNNTSNPTNSPHWKQHPANMPQKPRGFITPSGQIEIPDLLAAPASAYSSSAPRSSLVLFDDVASVSTATTMLEPLGEPTNAAKQTFERHFCEMHSDDDSNTDISSTKFSMFNRSKLAPAEAEKENKHEKVPVMHLRGKSESFVSHNRQKSQTSPIRHQRHKSQHSIDVGFPTVPKERTIEADFPSTAKEPSRRPKKSVKILSPPPLSESESDAERLVVAAPPSKVAYAVDFVDYVEQTDTQQAQPALYTANTRDNGHSIHACRYPKQSSPHGKLSISRDQAVPAPLSTSSMSSYQPSKSDHTGSTAPSEVVIDLTRDVINVTTVTNTENGKPELLISVKETVAGEQVDVVLVEDEDDDELASIYSKYRRNYLFRNSSTLSKESKASSMGASLASSWSSVVPNGFSEKIPLIARENSPASDAGSVSSNHSGRSRQSITSKASAFSGHSWKSGTSNHLVIAPENSPKRPTKKISELPPSPTRSAAQALDSIGLSSTSSRHSRASTKSLRDKVNARAAARRQARKSLSPEDATFGNEARVPHPISQDGFAADPSFSAEPPTQQLQSSGDGNNYMRNHRLTTTPSSARTEARKSMPDPRILYKSDHHQPEYTQSYKMDFSGSASSQRSSHSRRKSTGETLTRPLHSRGKSIGSYYDYTNDHYDFNSFMQSRNPV